MTPRLRADRENDELTRLAPWAQRAVDSGGREHAEPEHRFRTAYERDRARIIHSRAFRRLEYKTQVFLNGTGDHLRTRLTHTMEVASISRALAAALGLNEDLTETIALAHDLGHPPFGHAGEETLEELMTAHGGFEHNRQSLRVVELIERKFSEARGLNLTYETLEGLRKHDDGFVRPAFEARGVTHPSETFPQPSLEAQMANLADEIAYYSHDLDDGLDHCLITEVQLGDLALWRRCAQQVHTQRPVSSGREARANIIRTLTDVMVEGLIEHTAARIEAAAIDAADAARRHPEPLAQADEGLRRDMRDLRAFLFAHLYHHPEIAAANERGRSLLRTLFAHYLDRPSDIGSTYRARIEEQGLHRSIADYLAGMTDRYVVDEARRLNLA